MGLLDGTLNKENDALGRRRHRRQQECRQGFRPENPIHSTHSARRSIAVAMVALPGAAPPQSLIEPHPTPDIFQTAAGRSSLHLVFAARVGRHTTKAADAFHIFLTHFFLIFS